MKKNNIGIVIFILLFIITFTKTAFGALEYFYWYGDNVELGPYELADCQKKLSAVAEGWAKSPTCYKNTPMKVTGVTTRANAPLTEGKFNDSVTIKGEGFKNITKVSFGSGETTGTLENSESIIATIPSNATTGKITVTSSTRGKVESATVFKINSTSTLRWYFHNTNGQLMGPGNLHDTTGFADKASCDAARAKYMAGFTSITIKECSQATVADATKEVGADPYKTSNAQAVEPVKVNNFETDYTLLAPIGNLKAIGQEQGSDPECKITNAGKPLGIGCYMNVLLLLAIGLCGGLAVIMIVIRGVQYMGDESVFGKTEAKHHIMAAILGLLLSLGAYAILNTINPKLVGGKLTVSAVEIELEEDSAPILSDTGKTVPTKGSNSCPEGFTRVTTASGVIFVACKSIADNLKKMIDTAATAGIKLSGGGFRTNAEQIELRKANCGGDIYIKPSRQCKPPTARPGNSMHESGKAFDLRCDGALINFEGKQSKFTNTPSTKKCFDWLKANAGNYGLQNLPSENWHWSTNGK